MSEEPPVAPVVQSKIFKPKVDKRFNWEGYFAGMWVSAIRSGTGAILAFSGTQAAEAIAPVALQHIGMSFQQAAAAGISALLFDIIRYINLKPVPDVREDSTAPFNS